MLTIETIATVSDEGVMTARVPTSLCRGDHRVVIVMEEAPLTLAEPRRFPDMAAFRERLGAPAHAGNTVVEMRGEERS